MTQTLGMNIENSSIGYGLKEIPCLFLLLLVMLLLLLLSTLALPKATYMLPYVVSVTNSAYEYVHNT